MTSEQRESVVKKYRTSASIYASLKDMLDSCQPTIGCDGAIAVEWCGMWLCIEKDGYTHS